MSFIGTYECVKKRKFEEINLFYSEKRFHGKIGSWERFRAISTLCTPHCGFYEIFVHITTFGKISVKTIPLVKSLLYNWFHEIIFKWYKNFGNSTLWGSAV